MHQARQANIEVVIAYAPECPAVLLGDAVRLRQVLVNLLGNAFKFTQQGRISLQVKPVKARDGAAEDALLFSIHDSGIGIDAAQMQRLFKPLARRTVPPHADTVAQVWGWRYANN